MEYSGSFYTSIGDFLGEAFNDFGFTKRTYQEVDFLVQTLGLHAGTRILDVGCGTGRHSLELARRGYHTMGVDISQGLVEVGRRQAREENLSAEFAVVDARTLPFESEFDAAICLCEGAFGLAGNEAGHRHILAGMYRALKPGAPVILTAINVLRVARGLELDESGHLAPSGGPGDHKTVAFDPYTCTSTQRVTIRNPEGETREVEIFTTAFTYRELLWLFREAGFEVEGGYRSFSQEPIGFDHSEVMVVARRPEIS